MKQLLFLLLFLCSISSYSQVTGIVFDSDSKQPLEYVNVWIKNTMIGATTDKKGVFSIDRVQIGDTILITNLGFQEEEFLAKSFNEIALKQKEIALKEVVIVPLKQDNSISIKSYKTKGKIKEYYFNGHYSLARYFPNNGQYIQTPYIKSVSTVTLNNLDNGVTLRLQLIEADQNGFPTQNLLSEAYILQAKSGKEEIKVDLIDELIRVPKNGFFIVIDRLNLEENKYSNKLAKNVLQPAIGLVNAKDDIPNTWMLFGGKWIPPNELKKFTSTNKNIAINLEFTD